MENTAAVLVMVLCGLVGCSAAEFKYNLTEGPLKNESGRLWVTLWVRLQHMSLDPNISKDYTKQWLNAVCLQVVTKIKHWDQAGCCIDILNEESVGHYLDMYIC